MSKSINSPGAEPQLISVAAAAKQLGIHPQTVRSHLPLVRIGDRTLVRVADVNAVVMGGSRG